MKSKPEPEKGSEALEATTPSIVESVLKARSEFERFLKSRVSDPAAAEDLLQKSLLKAVEKQSSLHSEESIIEWFYRVLRNTLIDHYRSSQSHNEKDRKFAEEERILGTQEQMSPDEMKTAVCACMHRLLPTLKPSYAELIQKIDLDGEPTEKVARELGLTTGNLTVRLHRARQALKTSLQSCCGACSKHGCLNCTCQ